MKIKIGVILILICLSFSSCSDFYFSSPQPIDEKNIYSVPKKYRGLWQLENSATDKNTSIDYIIIGKKYYKRTTKSQLKEAKSVMDLDSNTYFIDNKVYSYESGSLEGGFDYTIRDDTVIIEVVDTELIEYGENAFLRKFNYGYILNLKHKKMNNWWNIKFIDTRSKEGIIIRELKEADLEKNKNYKILHEDFSKYLIANWTKDEIEVFINNGGFSDSTLFLKYDKKIKQ